MGFRFHKSIRLIPGVRLNFGKRSSSLSVGGKGFTTNFSGKGVRNTVSLPGTGLSYSTYQKHGSQKPQSPATRQRTKIFAVVILIVFVGICLLAALGSK